MIAQYCPPNGQIALNDTSHSQQKSQIDALWPKPRLLYPLDIPAIAEKRKRMHSMAAGREDLPSIGSSLPIQEIL